MLRLSFAILVIVTMVFSSAFSEGPATEGEKKPGKKEFKFVGVGKCYKCHKGSEDKGDGPYEIWLKSPHARAYEALGTEKAKAAAKKRGIEGDPQESPACLKCHSSKLGVAKNKTDEAANFSHTVEKDGEKKSVESLGLECEACHGPGSAYKSRSIMADREEAMRNGLWDAKKRCVVCHDPKNDSKFDFKKAFKKIAHAPKPDGDEAK